MTDQPIPTQPESINPSTESTAAPPPEPTINSPEVEAFFSLIAEAEGGSEFAMARLRQMLDSDPRLTQALGDLTGQLRLKLVRQIAGEELIRREAVETNLSNMMARVEADHLQNVPQRIKSLLITGLSLAWLELHLTEMQVSINRSRRMVQRFWADQLKQSQRRYMSALTHVIESSQAYAA